MCEWIAALYHDVVYNPANSDNEEEAFNLLLKMGFVVSQEQKDYVKDIIMATKDHLNSPLFHLENLVGILLNADLDIFSADDDTYDEYMHNIEKEYLKNTYIKSTVYILKVDWNS